MLRGFTTFALVHAVVVFTLFIISQRVFLAPSRSWYLPSKQRAAGESNTTRQSRTDAIKWAIFTAPKPIQAGPSQVLALFSWTKLDPPPDAIYLAQAPDISDDEVAEWKSRIPQIQVLKFAVKSNTTLRLDLLFERASRELVDAVAVVNSDIVLYNDFTEALSLLTEQFPRFFMIGSRYDTLKETAVPTTSEIDSSWLENLRKSALLNGELHTFGGTDYYAWRPLTGETATVSAIGGRIPPFSIGRPKADNWIIDRAIDLEVVDVVDSSAAVTAVHLKHEYHVVRSEKYSGHQEKVANQSAREIKNFWSSLKGGDDAVILNKHLAYTCGNYSNQDGTPLHAPWVLMTCETPKAKPYLCLRRRTRPAQCNCENSAFFRRTQTDPLLQGRLLVCGKKSMVASETFPDEMTFPLLVRQRAGADGMVILMGFNNGYQQLLLNMVRIFMYC
jgi:hypothetical protein